MIHRFENSAQRCWVLSHVSPLVIADSALESSAKVGEEWEDGRAVNMKGPNYAIVGRTTVMATAAAALGASPPIINIIRLPRRRRGRTGSGGSRQAGHTESSYLRDSVVRYFLEETSYNL